MHRWNQVEAVGCTSLNKERINHNIYRKPAMFIFDHKEKNKMKKNLVSVDEK